MGKHDPILRETFLFQSSPYSVFLFHHQITWCPQKRGGEDMSEWMNAKLRDIVAVEIPDNDDGENKSTTRCCFNPLNKEKDIPTQSIIVHYAQKKKDSEDWRVMKLQMAHEDSTVLNNWQSAIQSALNELKYRPKNLLFFVNPYGGKRKAVSIFEHQVKPILQVSGVKWTEVRTQRRNHATECLSSMSQSKLLEYDVVVGVGGDGTMCEVVSGLLTRGFSSSASLEEKDLKPSDLPVAVIPAGSSNALAHTLHGTGDPKTAAIHIILGGTLPLDVGAIHTHSGISRFIVGQMSYGHLADTMLYSEKLRWMGPKRYDYAGLRKFLGHATYEGSVDMRVAVDDYHKIPSQCAGGNGCEDCTVATKSDRPVGEWKRVEGRFLGISGANISCRCALSPLGIAPFAHLSDGHIDLILIRKASRLNHLRYLLRLGGDSRRAFALPFVERYRVDEFIFTPMQCCGSTLGIESTGAITSVDGSSSSIFACGCDARQQKKNHSLWNCDGELFYQPSVRVSVHKNLVRIMARSQGDVHVTLHQNSMPPAFLTPDLPRSVSNDSNTNSSNSNVSQLVESPASEITILHP